MTATIPAKYTNPRSLEIAADAGDVCVRIVSPDGSFVGLRVDPAALLAAINTELNVITRRIATVVAA